ncbi:MAG: hypothetical protein ACLPXB_18750 [Thiobacillaceae bacterium]
MAPACCRTRAGRRAEYNLGVRYRQGAGVPLDLSEAARWIELAAKGGYSDVQNDWGVMLR